MRAHVLTVESHPPPWGEPASGWPVLNRPARQWLDEALAEAGVDQVEPDQLRPGDLVLSDDLLLTVEFLRAFLDAPADGPTVAALAPSLLASGSAGRSALPVLQDGSLPVPLLRLGNAAPPKDLDELLAACRAAAPVPVELEERTQQIDVPLLYSEDGEGHSTVGATVRVALHLRHRSALLQGNLALLSASLLRTVGKPKLLLALRYLWERLRPGPRRLFSSFGKGCKIHPTAIVEASRLGDGVEFGAHAIVRGSVIGDGAVIEDAAHVQISSLGPRVRVARQCYVFCAVAMEGAHAAQKVMQFSSLGRHAVTTSPSWFLDFQFGRNVRVEDGDCFIDSGFAVLGCDVGHKTVVGGGVITAPGRALPSNAFVVTDPSRLLNRFDAALTDSLHDADAQGAWLVVRDGTLERLER